MFSNLVLHGTSNASIKFLPNQETNETYAHIHIPNASFTGNYLI